MSQSARPLPPMEVNRVGRPSARPTAMVNPVDHDDLGQAKAHVGAAVKSAIGDQPLKQFGDKGLMSKVCAGEKVPDYLARIYQDREARRRFVRAWLKDDGAVRVRVVYEFEEERTA